MLDLIFEMVCENKYHVMVLTIREEKLYAIPCDDAMSGYYPVYEKQMQLSEFKVSGFGSVGDDDSIEGILVRKNSDGSFDIEVANDSWDGFQPLG